MTDDWFDLLAAKRDNDVHFLVAGAHALAAHGIPRATNDLNIWIDPTRENAERVWRALAEFGAPTESLQLTIEDLSRADVVIQLGVPPLRIDLLTGLTGISDFNHGWSGRLEHRLRGRVIPFLGRTALVATKRASGRPKDLADLHALGESPGP